MRCPYCNCENHRVTDKRMSAEDVIRRRRECTKCEKRFTTYERIGLETIYVLKKEGKREAFDRAKIMAGIVRSAEKRIPTEKLEGIVDAIEAKVRSMPNRELPSRKIGEMVLRALKKEDHVAFLRFASVHKDFEDIESFKDEIDKLTKKARGVS